MTEAQGVQVLEHLEHIEFYGQVIAITLCFIAGAFSWKLWVYGKNQRDFY